MTALLRRLFSSTALLYKPVDRVTRSTLVLHVSQSASTNPQHHLLRLETVLGIEFVHVFLFQDLLKHTSSSHPDYLLLQDALRISQNFLSSINEEITPRRQSMTVKKGEVSVCVAFGFGALTPDGWFQINVLGSSEKPRANMFLVGLSL